MDKTIINKIWNFLCSVKLTIFLLVLLACTSIIGTVIPQGDAEAQFIRSMSPFWEKAAISFQLYDMYHSLWFQIIILILALNLIACTVNRLPVTSKLYRKEPKPDRELIFKDIPLHRIIKIKKKKSHAAGQVKETLNRQYVRVLNKDTDKASFFYADKGRYSLFGFYLVHLSIILILAGAVVGSFFGFKGFITLVEGESADSMVIQDRTGHSHKDLGFSIHCDDFNVEFYENGRPKEFKSDLRFSINSETVKQGHLLVNHPLSFKGITFYQSSYGSVPGNSARIMLDRGEGQEPEIINMEKGKPVPLPNMDGEFALAEVRDDFMRMGPAVSIAIKPKEGNIIQLWLFKNYETIKKQIPDMFRISPKLNPSIFKPYTFSLADVDVAGYYTGLQIKSDPGIIFIYTGFLFIIAGLIITFFSSHRRVWIKLSGDEDTVIVTVAGMASKNPVGLEKELDRLSEQFNNILK